MKQNEDMMTMLQSNEMVVYFDTRSENYIMVEIETNKVTQLFNGNDTYTFMYELWLSNDFDIVDSNLLELFEEEKEELEKVGK